MSALDSAGAGLVALSRWIDAGQPSTRAPEAITWGRLAKISEEAGEVIAAFIGATGQNPRKGVTHTVADVGDELLDVAITALGAYEHLSDHQGLALPRLAEKIHAVVERAGMAGKPLGRIPVGLKRVSGRPGFSDMWDGGRWVPICDGCGDEAAYCDGTRHNQAVTP